MIDVNEKTRTWPSTSAAFRRSRERHGALSNMTPGMPLVVAGLRFSGSEALYQALKFPALPEVQRAIAAAGNGFDAKRLAWNPALKRQLNAPWWNRNRAAAMAYAVAAKLAAHPQRIAAALRDTAGRPIVESSDRDPFWGARPTGGGTFDGANVLGQVLMLARQALQAAPTPQAAAAALAAKALEAASGLRLAGKPLPPV